MYSFAGVKTRRDMSDFKIEKDVPLPRATWRTAPEYPFAEMEIGDSFYVPKVKQGTLRSRVEAFKKRHSGIHLNKKFALRTIRDGIRVWRTK